MTVDTATDIDVDDSFVPVQAPSVATAELDGEAVLYNETDGAIHVLNSSAAVVWSCFDGKATVGEIAADLAAAYSVEPDVMSDHVRVITADLASKALVSAAVHLL